MKKRISYVAYSILIVLAMLTTMFVTSCDNNSVEKTTYNVVLPQVVGGSVTSNVSTVKEGESVELIVTPDTYYELSYLKVNQEAVDVTNNKAIIENVQSDLNVDVKFIGVEVEITLVVGDTAYKTYKSRYGEVYKDLAAPTLAANQEFVGWYTEKSGQGSLITSESKVNSGIAHSLYAYYTEKPIDVEVSGIVDKLTNLPNSEAQTAELVVSVTSNGADVTSDSDIVIFSSDTSKVVVEGMKLSVASGAEGSAMVIVKVNGIEYKKFTIEVMDYAGLGYKAISSIGDFKTMTGTGKYVFTNDIELNSSLGQVNGSPLIDKLDKDAVIDGNGHFISNAKLPSGANNAWIKTVEGTVKNIAFINLTTAESEPYATGLFGVLKAGALLENIYVDALIVADGSYDTANKSGGVLVGTLEGGNINSVILNVNAKKGVSLEAYGAFAGVVSATCSAKVTNSYALINNIYLREIGNEYKYNAWFNSVIDNSGVVYNSVHTFIQEMEENTLLHSGLWNIIDENVYYNDKVILSVEDEFFVEVEDKYELDLDEIDYYVDYKVYYFGEEINDYTVSNFVSSDESIFTVDSNGKITIVSAGEAKLTFTINDSINVETIIYVKPEYYLISTVEEFRTLLAKEPGGKFKLANNIDFNGDFVAGADATNLVATFSGELDGQGYAILNMKLPGGWNGHSLFNVNTGTIKNIAFLNTIGPTINTNSGIIADNKGLIENVYVDYIFNADGREYGFAGTLSGYAGIGITRNCITNVRLGSGLSVAPDYFGSISGNANAWAGSMNNCYSIVHDSGTKDIAAMEGASGILKQFKNQGSKQFQTYTQLQLEADLSTYDASIWSFEEDQIIFGHNVVYTLQPDDEYAYIDSPEKFVSAIESNPDGKFRLAKDIDFAGKTITFSNNNVVFTGELDGLGHVISNAVMVQNNIFVENTGTISNIAFVNLKGPKNLDMAGLILENKGRVDNIFVDFVIRNTSQDYNFAGAIAAVNMTGTITSVIVNLKLDTNITIVPTAFGGLCGLVSENSIIKNSYAISNEYEFTDFAIMSSEDGAIETLRANGCNQYDYYSQIKEGGETFETFNSKYWKFTNAQIKYNGVIVVIDKTQDEYIYISTVKEWKTLISADPTAKYKLANDIDFNGDWLTAKDASVLADTFTGVLDGQGYKIMNAKLPGGWNGHAIFNYNEGTIKNIAFINILCSPVTTQTSLFNINRGIIENLYVDYVLQTSTYASNYNGVVCTFADNQLSKDKPSIIRNCIVNVRLKDGATLPSAQGSIVGKAGGWTGYVYNCYAIINDTGISGVCFDPNGSVAETTLKTCAQFETYQELHSNADVSMYDTEIWSFNDTTISFFGRVVYTAS